MFERKLEKFMALMWPKGKSEIGFTLQDIYQTLEEFTGDKIISGFFKKNISKIHEYGYADMLDYFGMSATEKRVSLFRRRGCVQQKK